MSSLEQDVFFGSRQNALDSYLKARERRREEEEPRKGMVYPNILDEISYQKSFDRQISQPSQPSQLYRFNSMAKSSDLSLLNESVNIIIDQMVIKDNSIKEGSCIQIKISLGIINLSQLIFFTLQPINLQSYLTIQPTQQSLNEYFQQIKAKCLKIEIIHRNTNKPMGASFLPAQTLLILLSQYFQTHQPTSKPISLKLSKNSRIQFLLKITKEVSIKTVKKKHSEILTQKQKCTIVIEDHTLNQQCTLHYNDKECPTTKGTQLCIEIERSTKSLNQGIIFQIKNNEIIGIVTVAAIPLFLNQSLKGTYVICHPQTMQYVGTITLSIHQKIIKQIPKQKLVISQPIATQAVYLSLDNIYLKNPSSDNQPDNYRILCYMDSTVKSRLVQFTPKHSNLHISQQIQFTFEDVKSMHLAIQLYAVGRQYDKIVSNAEIEIKFPIQPGLFMVQQHIDSKSENIVKYDVTIGVIRDTVKSQNIPIAIFYKRLQFQVGEMREQLKKQLDITHLQADRIMSLCSQEFIRRFEGRRKGRQLMVDAYQLSRELEYADREGSGYVSKEVMVKILSYFNVGGDVVSDYVVEQKEQISDLVYDRRNGRDNVSYLPLLAACVKEEKEVTEVIQKGVDIVGTLKTDLTFVLVRCTNLNAISKTPPNSYIVQPDSNQVTQVKYRDCNPQFHCEFKLYNWTKHSIQLILIHKDLKSKDQELTRIYISTNRLTAAIYGQAIKVPINHPNCHLIIQKH